MKTEILLDIEAQRKKRLEREQRVAIGDRNQDDKPSLDTWIWLMREELRDFRSGYRESFVAVAELALAAIESFDRKAAGDKACAGG